MKKALALLFFTLLFSPSIFATIKIHSVSGASYVEADSAGKFTAYGGIAGTCIQLSPTSTCNTCATNTVLGGGACNPQSVHKDLRVSVTFSSDQALNNAKVEIHTDGSSAGGYSNAFPVQNVTAATGQQVTVSAPWGFFCENDENFGSFSCAPSSSSADQVSFKNTTRNYFLFVDENLDGKFDENEKTVASGIRLHYINPNSTAVNSQAFCNLAAPGSAQFGACGYELGAGDSKLYLQQLFVPTGGLKPETGGAPEWLGVALFAAPVANVSQITTSMVPAVIRNYSGNQELADPTVDGLANYTDYCVLMGNINKAYNIYRFNSQTANVADTCMQPSEVVGMLSDKSCFISTAAFGSSMAPEVESFREFRNHFLLSHDLGQKFVKLYYKLSPPVANFISKSEILRAASRGVLYPILGFALIANEYGIGWALVIYLFGFSILVVLVKQKFFRVRHD